LGKYPVELGSGVAARVGLWIGGMIATQTRVLVALMVLGGTPLPEATAELPKPGKYSGTLTVTKNAAANNVEASASSKFRAFAQVGSDGTFMVLFAGTGLAEFTNQIFLGKIVEDGPGLFFENGTGFSPLILTVRGREFISFSYSAGEADKPEFSDENGVPHKMDVSFSVKLTRVGR
jgi:hypothetical protein